MEKKLAMELMQLNLQLGDAVNEIAKKVEEIGPGEELIKMRRHTAEVMAAVDMHLFMPLLSQYPDIDPHK